MRQIKFRAWDKNKKVMFVGIEIKELLKYLFMQQYPNADAYLHIKENFENILWIPSTGLLDKNGKEIYEGDVIEIRTPEDYGGENEPDGKLQYLCTQEVKRSKESSGFFSEEDNGDYCPALGSDEIEVEIIGNIYENPELLK